MSTMTNTRHNTLIAITNQCRLEFMICTSILLFRFNYYSILYGSQFLKSFYRRVDLEKIGISWSDIGFFCLLQLFHYFLQTKKERTKIRIPSPFILKYLIVLRNNKILPSQYKMGELGI